MSDNISALREAAEADNDAQKQFTLGNMYYDGAGVEPGL